MSRETILELIEANHDRLRGLGVRELGLFGSFARGEARPDSDVDFFVDLDQKSFDRYMAVKELLEEILARKVDLVLKSAIKPRLRDVILREAVRAA
jgi:predicted nucleotidyltransferase